MDPLIALEKQLQNHKQRTLDFLSKSNSAFVINKIQVTPKHVNTLIIRILS